MCGFPDVPVVAMTATFNDQMLDDFKTHFALVAMEIIATIPDRLVVSSLNINFEESCRCTHRHVGNKL